MEPGGRHDGPGDDRTMGGGGRRFGKRVVGGGGGEREEGLVTGKREGKRDALMSLVWMYHT